MYGSIRASTQCFSDGYLNSPSKINKEVYGDNFMIKNTLKIWKQIRSHTTAPNTYYDSQSFSKSFFCTWSKHPGFMGWNHKGIKVLSDLYLDGHFMSFEQLCTVYDIPAAHFFKYLQIRDYVRTNVPNFENFSSNKLQDNIIQFNPQNPGAVRNKHMRFGQEN